MSFRISQPSFQSLYIEMKAYGNTIAKATAFVASSSIGVNFLVTNRHNVTGRHQETGELLSKTAAIPDSLTVWHNSNSGLGEFVEVEIPLYECDSPRWIEHPTLLANADFVALPLVARDDIFIYPYRTEYFAHTYIEPGQTVNVVGFPFGERTGPSLAIWSTGFIASEPEIDHGGRPIFLIDCRSRSGQSGSPVIQSRNLGELLTYQNGTEVVSSGEKLLGIYSGRINDESDIGIVWKTYAILELLDCASMLTE